VPYITANPLIDDPLINAILSAVYHSDEALAGEVLLKCLRSANGELRMSFMRVVHTFLQMHRTDFLVASFLEEMEIKGRISKEDASEANDLIEGVREFEEMFSKHPRPSLDEQ